MGGKSFGTILFIMVIVAATIWGINHFTKTGVSQLGVKT